MKVCVYGLWHLGLVTVAGLSKLGHSVIGLDSFDVDLLNRLNKGQISIYEPGVSEAIINGIKHNNTTFTNDPRIALHDVDFIWVTFDTPIDSNDDADVDYIENKIMDIAYYLKDKTKLIISSQVPVGFTEKLERKLSLKFPNKKIYFAYSPENLRLGNALEIFNNPDRIIIGVHPEDKKEFEIFFHTISPLLIWMDIPSAEMTKHAINTFLAMSICFANEIARICDDVGASPIEVETGLKTDSRIGYKSYTRSGDAYSGGTLARDVMSLFDTARRSYIHTPLIFAISESNEDHKIWIQSKCLDVMNNVLEGRVIMIFGLTYKEGTNTLRRSGSLELCEWLHKQGCIIYAYDDLVQIYSEIPDYINIVDDPLSIDFDCAVILKDICKFDKEILRDKIVIDPNGYYEGMTGMKYFSVRRINHET
jgi:UDPglucose 6-dehydrogenase